MKYKRTENSVLLSIILSKEIFLITAVSLFHLKLHNFFVSIQNKCLYAFLKHIYESSDKYCSYAFLWLYQGMDFLLPWILSMVSFRVLTPFVLKSPLRYLTITNLDKIKPSLIWVFILSCWMLRFWFESI